MDRWELWALGIVSILALLVLLFGSRSLTGALVDESTEVFEVGTEIFKSAPQHYPRFSYVPLGTTAGPQPPKESLVPETISLQVDRIPIPEYNYYHFISLRRDRLHTFSGDAGYYASDPRKHVQGQLCAYAYKINGAPLRCERVPLNYADGRVVFARGYAEDEYIGYQAAGTDFAAVFLLTNPEYGILASSPVAFLHWTFT